MNGKYCSAYWPAVSPFCAVSAPTIFTRNHVDGYLSAAMSYFPEFTACHGSLA